ncbi:MAG: GH92 family glycosyl hydrolase [Bacteroidales bacterium]|nr:GH92 family glycosyl hydrolase [Bacteroidales bacterium]
MIKITFKLFLLCIVICSMARPLPGKNLPGKLTGYVNPFIGTDGHGHTFPGATYPFGMIQLSPDTRLSGWDGCSGYHYSDSFIYGFSHTHLNGTGCEDYCDILIMPVVGYSGNIIDRDLYKSEFSHKKESASPGYYSVYLNKGDIIAELTTGRRAGMHRYTYRQFPDKPQIIIDLTHRDFLLDSRIEVVDNQTIKGFRRSSSWAKDQIVYFYIKFSRPIISEKVDNKKALLTFLPDKTGQIVIKSAISSVSEENARMNLESETDNWNFEKIRKKTESAWEAYLNKIKVTPSDNKKRKEQLTTFYTALYHTAISPSLYSDINGEYRGIDRKVHIAKDYEQYTVFSLWDTFRALHPLFTIIEQKRDLHFIKSLLANYTQAGKLPIWELSGNETNCMIGYHSVPVIYDAYVKGIKSFDAELALEAMVKSSQKKEFAIDLLPVYGCVPADIEHESVSKTLEYAYDDWNIAMMAKNLGHNNLYQEYIARAQFYKNIFDSATGFMRPKLKGRWLTPFDPSEINVHYTEANSWQYSFFVPHDIEGHIKLSGGDAEYIKKLDALFSASTETSGWKSADVTGLIGMYAHGNEPSHHVAYLYDYAGRPSSAQKRVREIMRTLYSPDPAGLCGNEDCGQMSAWYIMSAMGFYPVCPGDDTYALGSPLFSKIVIKTAKGRSFTINAPLNSEENIYVTSAFLNNSPQNKMRSYIKHGDIMSGGILTLEMSNKEDSLFGFRSEDRPHSRIDSDPIVTNPWFVTPSLTFRDSTSIEIKAEKGYSVFYKRDSDKEYQLYTSPQKICKTTSFSAYSEDKNRMRSHTVFTTLNKVNPEWKITILSKYSSLYTANGDEGLIDGLRGERNFRLGGWQGYQNFDFEAIIDLGKPQTIKKISAGFLQDVRSWIWMPEYVEFFISTDGNEYTSYGRVQNRIDIKDYEPVIQELFKEGEAHNIQYVRIFAKNFGKIPDWHLGAGGDAYIFTDEISINN